MRSLLLVASVLLTTACATKVSDVMPIGKDTYMLDVDHAALGSGLTSHAELRQAAIKRANEFCMGQAKEMRLSHVSSEGHAGWGSISTSLTFMCFVQGDPRNTPVKIEKDPDTVIRIENAR
jgi:hypothetical protein